MSISQDLLLFFVLRALLAISTVTREDSDQPEACAQDASLSLLQSKLEVQRITSKQKEHRFHNVVLCTQVRNEVGSLPEWLEYHRRLGVDWFRLYDDGSTDDVKELPGIMARAANAPVYLEVVPSLMLPKDPVDDMQYGATPHQRENFKDCLRHFKDKANWIGVTDVDEFIAFPAGSAFETLPQLMASIPQSSHWFYIQAAKFGPTTSWSSEPIYQVASDSKCLKLRSSQVDLVIDSHTRRGLLPDLQGESKAYEALMRNMTEICSFESKSCEDRRDTYGIISCEKLKMDVCIASQGKSFRRAGQCMDFRSVHECGSPPRKGVEPEADWNALPRTQVRLNHYYMKSIDTSEQKHKAQRAGSRQEMAERSAQVAPVHTIVRDESASRSVSTTQVRSVISAALC